MRKIMCRVLVALFITGLFYFPAVSTAESADVPNLSGKWVGYYNDGSKSEYVWAIRQTGSTLSIENVGVRQPSRKDALKAIKFLRKTLRPKTESCLLTALELPGRTASFGKSNN